MTLPARARTALSERIRQGDTAAEEELVQTFAPRVFAMALARTRDREASRDIVQDVLWTVIQALRNGQLRQSDKLASFVSGTARNLINNYRRTETRSRRDQSLLVDPSVFDPAEDQDDEERRQLVRRAIAELAEIDRRILWLTLVEGLAPGEIAARLRLSPDVVRQRKSRAIKRVMGILGDRLR